MQTRHNNNMNQLPPSHIKKLILLTIASKLVNTTLVNNVETEDIALVQPFQKYASETRFQTFSSLKTIKLRNSGCKQNPKCAIELHVDHQNCQRSIKNTMKSIEFTKDLLLNLIEFNITELSEENLNFNDKNTFWIAD